MLLTEEEILEVVDPEYRDLVRYGSSLPYREVGFNPADWAAPKLSPYWLGLKLVKYPNLHYKFDEHFRLLEFRCVEEGEAKTSVQSLLVLNKKFIDDHLETNLYTCGLPKGLWIRRQEGLFQGGNQICRYVGST